MIFKKPKNLLEGHGKLVSATSADISDDLMVNCPRCKKPLASGDLHSNLNVCIYCGHHFRLNVQGRW